MADLLFVGQFIASRVGKTGLNVTVDVDKYTLSNGTRTALVTGGSATEGRRGLYHYRLAAADLATYQYVATFITAAAAVDQQEVAALGLVVPDALVSSVADAVLLRDWEDVTGTVPDRSTLNALRFLRNKWLAGSATLTVYEEDDATPAWEAALTTNLGADRITGVTPE